MALTKSDKENGLRKAPTGIAGLDEITGGGLPRGRPTLVCGSAGCGKTLLAMKFLVHGAQQMGEPGVFVSFEETQNDLAQNVASLGFDLQKLIAQKKLAVDWVRLERSEVEETGEFDLDGLFVRLAYAIDSVGAKRVALDTLEGLFSGLPNPHILRSEIRRLFQWLKDKGVTAVITGERDRPDQLTRHGLEEFVSDCVIVLDHRVNNQISTRRLRIVKYRGSHHGTNEYPFLIDEQGISVLPISGLGLKHSASNARISTGVERLDVMLGGKGYFRGSSILVTGTAGSGKSSLAATFADSVCRGKERCVYFAFEESPPQIMRNMKSIGLDLQRWVDRDLLRFHASRPTHGGVEQHLVAIHKIVAATKPAAVIIDPITNLTSTATSTEVESMLTRLVDHFKVRGITALFTSLTPANGPLATSNVGLSSLMDTWVLLQMIEVGGERNRSLYILKSRGMPHSNQIREFVLTSNGIELRDVYLGQEGVLTGSARLAQQTRDSAASLQRVHELERIKRTLDRERRRFDAQMRQLQTEFESEEEELLSNIKRVELDIQTTSQNRAEMAQSRQADAAQTAQVSDRAARSSNGRKK